MVNGKLSEHKVYTSYYGKACRELPSSMLISISRGTPDNFDGQFIRELNPSESLLRSFKSGKITWEEYRETYYLETLSKLNAYEIYEKCRGKVLLCYCKEFEQCHRSLVLEWLANKLADNLIGGEIHYEK